MVNKENIPKVEKQVTFLIVPFAFRAEYENTDRLIDHSNFEEKTPVSERLYDHVQNLISPQGRKYEAIGRRFVLKDEVRTKWNLPNRKDTFLTYQYSKQSFSFSIESIELYVFETQVGFVLFKIGHPKFSSIEQMIETNYHIKRLGKLRNTKVFYDKKTGKDTLLEQEIHLNDLIDSFLSNLEVDTYFEGDDTHVKQSLVFSAAFLNQPGLEESSVTAWLFRMQRAFKDSYKPVKEMENRRDLFIPFDNSYWGVSLEGMANIVTKTNDTTADQFFGTDYFYRLENTYLFMYILALHQRYALLYFSKQISLLPYQLNQIEDQLEKQNELITKFRKNIVNFMLKCSYNQVSNVTHQSELYEMIRTNLKIEYLFTEINDELYSLSSLMEIIEQKKLQLLEEKKREKSDKMTKGIGLLSFVYLPLTIIPGLYTMILPFITENTLNWILAVLITLLSFVPTFYLLKKYIWVRLKNDG
ncbi:magnesium transporter CorA family protein [Cytobacillus dafuensis]|uniref:CorA-like Mg2+ transporter protein n=1 Tax=Cytobacillus dafuensis TaxID=1742359 RepID=A0A5B8Z9K3_CYTDA|nr:hypothetical protein [Cytobacillus dafuensis]QED48146.1 hypothetical protein FSZ17_13385 [Cytobacillus dafuensis]